MAAVGKDSKLSGIRDFIQTDYTVRTFLLLLPFTSFYCRQDCTTTAKI
jgi:hypothetical protein